MQKKHPRKHDKTRASFWQFFFCQTLLLRRGAKASPSHSAFWLVIRTRLFCARTDHCNWVPLEDSLPERNFAVGESAPE
jgi:hypothetical protein